MSESLDSPSPSVFFFLAGGDEALDGQYLTAGEGEDGAGRLCGAAWRANMAWMPSLRSAIGSTNEGDSVPTLPTSLGTW